MTERKLGQNHFRDPIYGRGAGGGRRGVALHRVRKCAVLVRNLEFPDDVAVAMLREAAGADRRVLPLVAEYFASRNWHGDPLLTHVSDLVAAAASGSNPVSVDSGSAEIIAGERRLLNEPAAEAYADLAIRQPALYELARQAGDPAWQTEQDRNPPLHPDVAAPLGVEIAPEVWASAPRILRWVLRPVARTAEKTGATPFDPRLSDFRPSLDEIESHRGMIVALGIELDRLVGPDADTNDPLLKTWVARALPWPHLLNVAGIPEPALPSRRSGRPE
jgi:hypothetical protein